jgi:hypothetical protein
VEEEYKEELCNSSPLDKGGMRNEQGDFKVII